MYETDALRLLTVVAGTGSFTAAADRLGYTQSAVSRRIASLEREAGGPLFERLPRGVRLTPAGEVLHRHAAAVLDRLDRAAEDLAALHRGLGGRLRVGAFASSNAVLLPRALRAFRADHPEVETAVVEGLSRDLLTALHDGALDLAVVSDYPSGLPRDGGAELVELLRDELLVALPRDHPLAGRDPVDLRDLAGETWIEAAPRGRPTMLQAACARAGFTPEVGMRVAGWAGKLGYVAEGLGVTLVPAISAPAVPSGLVLRSLGALAPRRTVLAALPGHAVLPAARALVRRLIEYGGAAR